MPQQFVFTGRQGSFSCTLHGERCAATTRTGLPCKRRTVIGLGLCWGHLLSEKKLRIRESGIPGGGKGLFAQDRALPPGAVVFKRGEVLTVYGGELVHHAETTRRYGADNAPYAVESTRGRREDAACRRGVGAMANTRRGGGRNNARLSRRNDGTHTLKASRSIRNNEEILLAYGPRFIFDARNSHTTRQRR